MSDGCANIKTVLLRMKGERERCILQHIMYVCVCVHCTCMFTIIKREIVSKCNYSISVVCMLIKSITSLGQKAVLVHSTCAITQ